LRQRKRMTTLGENITAVGVEGKFDDCQALVKQASADESVKRGSLGLTTGAQFIETFFFTKS
jgi:threonine synthase